MDAFSDASFDVHAYLRDRPRYPASLYARVFGFHDRDGKARGGRRLALDLGCGPGISSWPLAPHFDDVIGVDPSEGMVKEARQAWGAIRRQSPDKQGRGADQPGDMVEADAATRLQRDNVRFELGSADELDRVEALNDTISAHGGADLVVAAQAAHWFRYPQVWSQLAHITRPEGGTTLAFWGYGSPFLPEHPSLWPSMAHYMSSTARDGLGPYWPQPGRRIVENLLQDIPWPDGAHGNHVWDLASCTRVTHPLREPGVPEMQGVEEPFLMKSVQSFLQLAAYFRTSSALSRYYRQHPDKVPTSSTSSGTSTPPQDAVGEHVAALRREVLRQRHQGVGTDAKEGEVPLDDDHVEVAWPLGLMMIRSRPHGLL